MAGTPHETRSRTRRIIGRPGLLPVLALLVGLCAACGGAGTDGGTGSAPDAAGTPSAEDGHAPAEEAEPGETGEPGDTAGEGSPDPAAPALPDGLWIDPEAQGRTLTMTEGGATVTYSAGDPPTGCWGRPAPAGGGADGAVVVEFTCLAGDGTGDGSPAQEDRSALLRLSGDEMVVEWEDRGTETLVPDPS
ncbi:hypothetical protein [Streptomyces alkaliphilus]|uniref:hypothetical protein n=1 Tax=Streptomyces alkaliphilus TaxID=1472722 RepID=UPI00118119EC|nr:hypothetical protein [Streptomyces alkaliphilus]MQS05820.1 hypothetical protein [Streptomyces alkaliphilus]